MTDSRQTKDGKSWRRVIPPRSVIRLVRNDAKTNWKKDIGRFFRVGYYSRQDGPDVVWMVNEKGKYEQTIDHDDLVRYFHPVEISTERDLFGDRKPPFGLFVSSPEVRWYLAERLIATTLVRKQYRAALDAVHRFLRGKTSRRTRCEALGMRATLWEDLGEPKRAMKDWLASNGLSVPRSYSRYVRQFSLAVLCRKLGRPSEAIRWYRAALRTSAAAKDVSCGGVLKQLLELRPERELSKRDAALCRKAVRRSWTVLRLTGKPRPKSLVEVAERLRL